MTDEPSSPYNQTIAHERDVSQYRHPYPNFDYEERIAELAQGIEAIEADAAILPNHVDLTYYTGSGQPANLYVPAGDGGSAKLFVRRAMAFAKQESELPSRYLKQGGLSALTEYADDVSTLGVPLDAVPAALTSKLATALDVELVDVSDVVLSQRAIKAEGEVELLADAAELYEVAHDAIRRRAAPGVTEKEVAGEVIGALVAAGMDDRIFFRRWDARLPAAGLIASGDALPLVSGHAMTVTGTGVTRSMPWGPSNRPLENGDFLAADLALNWAGYHGDVARTYVIGEATPDQREWFHTVLTIHEEARNAVEPGAPAEVPYLAARECAEELGVSEWLCGYAEMQAPYIGHSIGLEADEEPTLVRGNTTELREGMVVTIEPKLIHPDRGTVVVEDDYLVTDSGTDRLSTTPQELFVISNETDGL
ncbi:Xaa-Pro peptidase family protein (plasmid) [Natrinema zhouii]|uniref:M24 family metallopeptidase n=1 Tax=Natrinema zhouii TaxID=1710539 RepID=UPI001D0000E3|nr:Xaa-Pro peptidase family protein [Natrinema zhouii]UHQ98750.1 Xaa-Pro peptidase family protein [Natrinema zhouii]